MAMLIGKFHRMIQSKVLWWTILGIIVLTFVVWGTATPTATQSEEANSPGKLNGKPVPQPRFRDAYFNSYLSVILSVGRAFNITPEIDKQLRQAAWHRIVSLDEAGRLGLGATDDEVAGAIQQNQAFHTQDGQFYKPAYKQFVDQFLAQLGFNERQFEEHIRQEIVLQKLRIVLDRTTLVPPRDLKRTFNSISDKFKIEYAILGADLVSNTVEIADADARAFFDKDPADFTLPEKMKVKFTRFAVAPLVEKTEVSPDDVLVYYNDHLDEYLAETNLVAAATNAPVTAPDAGDTNTVADAATNTLLIDTNLTVASKYMPFEEVKDQIAAKIRGEKAMDLAADRAMEFVMDLTPDRDGKAMSFEEAAKKYETLVETPAPFSQRETVPGVDAGLDFTRAAFSLSADERALVSEPVRGKKFVYVIGFEERIPSRVPAFEDVADEVLPLARAQAMSDALSGKAGEARDAALKAVKDGKPFSSVFGTLGVSVITSEQFTASTGPTTNEYGEILMRGIMTMNQGEVSELLPARDAVLLAHVVERVPGDPTTFDSLRQQIENTIRRQNGRLVYDGWQEYLLKQANFEERNLDVTEEEPVEDAPQDEGL